MIYKMKFYLKNKELIILILNLTQKRWSIKDIGMKDKS